MVRGGKGGKKGKKANNSATNIQRPNKFNELQDHEDESEATCKICKKTFTEKTDQLIRCERCNVWTCRACAKLTEDQYKFMTERHDLHWFCNNCEQPAMSAVLTHKNIEEKCQAYCAKITEWLSKVKNKVVEKADKDDLTNVQDRVLVIEDQIQKLAQDISTKTPKSR